jgi:hypothetical protein
MSTPRRVTTWSALAALALLGAACGSTAPAGTASGQPAATTSIPLATSLGGAGQPGWAVVEMGGSAASENNFWELFSRPAASARWRLATPLGVASNGGLMMAAAGTGLVAGFGPSQDLAFSPVATISAPTGDWSQNTAPVSPGLASVPDALASGPDGELLALTRSGEVLRLSAAGASSGTATWSPVTTLRALGATAAGRACGLTALTAVGFTAAGTPEVGGSCSRPGAAAILELQPGGGWQAVGPAPAGSHVTVLGLAAGASRATALLQIRALSLVRVIAAWSAAGTTSWTISPSVTTGAGLPRSGVPRSLQLGSNGSVALVLAGGRGVTIAGPGGSWQILAALPGRTATLASGPAGQLQALTAAGEWLRVWQRTAGGGWSQVQQVKVAIPYGSSS